MKCSENSCEEKAIKEIVIHAESKATDKKYQIWIFVCQKHYDMEDKVNNIIKVVRKLR